MTSETQYWLWRVALITLAHSAPFVAGFFAVRGIYKWIEKQYDQPTTTDNSTFDESDIYKH